MAALQHEGIIDLPKKKGSASEFAGAPLSGQRVLVLLAFVHHDITGTDGLAGFIAGAVEAVVVDDVSRRRPRTRS